MDNLTAILGIYQSGKKSYGWPLKTYTSTGIEQFLLSLILYLPSKSDNV